MEYITHDNGGRPFKVRITDNNVEVHECQNDILERQNNEYSSNPIFTFNPQQIFIGKSPLTEMTKFSGCHGEVFDGNTILLKMSCRSYVFIGATISKFQSLHEIVEYVSPIGNNAVPYPYAVDTKGNYYLLIGEVILKDVEENHADPNEWYRNHSLITKDMGLIPPTQPIIKDFWNIKEFYIGDDRYTLTYEPNAAADYDRVIPIYGEKMYIIYNDGKKTELSKEDYVSLMKEFGEKIKTQHLDVKVLRERL